MRNPFQSVVGGLLLLATVTVPSVLYMTLGASSGAVGVLIISGLYLFWFVACASLSPSQRSIAGVLFIAGIVAVVFTQGAVSLLINDEFDFRRFGQSVLLLIITIFGAFSLAHLSKRLSEEQADFSVRIVFYVLLLSGLAGILEYAPLSGQEFWKAVLFFAEPSHFALSFLPFLLYVVVLSGLRTKVCILVTSFMMAILLESLTLMVGVALVLFLAIPLRLVAFLVLIIVILLFAVDLDSLLPPVNLDYFLERVDFSRDNPHLSAMAFMQGWERAYLNLKDSFGLGVGFQQFGIVGKHGEMMEEIMKMNEGEELNLLDGGSVGSKFIGEFGILGVITLLVYLFYFARSARLLREVSICKAQSLDCKQVFFLSCFVMYCIDLFVRGAGYFSPSGFLFAASVLWMASPQSSGSRFKIPRLAGAAR